MDRAALDKVLSFSCSTLGRSDVVTSLGFVDSDRLLIILDSKSVNATKLLVGVVVNEEARASDFSKPFRRASADLLATSARIPGREPYARSRDALP